MRHLLTIFLLSIIVSCSKSHKEEDPKIVICPEPYNPAWLIEKKKSLSSCVCETAFLVGTYNGRQVIEQHLVDPACNGFDIVYNYSDGSVLFTSMNIDEFKKYKEGVTGLQELWRCSRPAAH